MAVKNKKKAKPKKFGIDLTLWDVILSYPDLHNPKPYDGKITYRTDVLLDADHPQLSELKKAIHKVRVTQWGDDKTEWPKKAKRRIVLDGNEREDSKGYKDRFYIKAGTQQPVPVIGLTGKTFNPQLVKGGMFANVGIRITVFDNDFGEGISVYLQAVQIDTKKPGLNFGGGKSVAKIFGLDEDGDDEDGDDEGDDDNGASDSEDSDDDDDTPRGKKSKKKTAKKKSSKTDEDDGDNGDSDNEDESEDDDSEE